MRKVERERETEGKFEVVVGWITKRGFRKGKRNSTGSGNTEKVGASGTVEGIVYSCVFKDTEFLIYW